MITGNYIFNRTLPLQTQTLELMAQGILEDIMLIDAKIEALLDHTDDSKEIIRLINHGDKLQVKFNSVLETLKENGHDISRFGS